MTQHGFSSTYFEKTQSQRLIGTLDEVSTFSVGQKEDLIGVSPTDRSSFETDIQVVERSSRGLDEAIRRSTKKSASLKDKE